MKEIRQRMMNNYAKISSNFTRKSQKGDMPNALRTCTWEVISYSVKFSHFAS